jgi:hypothetical protein
MKRKHTAQGALLVLASAGLCAQSLSMPPSTVTRGASGSLLLTLESPQGKAPVALQWEFTFPKNVVVDLADIAAGSSAGSAQKDLTCRAVESAKDGGQGSVYRCILAGGQKPIPNGPVATIRYRVPLEVRGIAERVRVGKAIGATADLKTVEIEVAQAAVTVK